MKVELNVSTTKCRRIIINACQKNGVSLFDIIFNNVTKQQGHEHHKGNKKAEINCKIAQVVSMHYISGSMTSIKESGHV